MNARLPLLLQFVLKRKFSLSLLHI